MNNYSNIMVISGDVYLIIKSMNAIGWKAIRESSINRLLYISSVVYSFRFPERKNIFEDNYHFAISMSGPEEILVNNALTNLLSNEIIERGTEGYILLEQEKDSDYESLPLYNEKKEWIDDMAYVIGIYGEEKIYDFVFRDPEYRTSLKSNSEYTLDISKSNETISFLNSFKEAFEKKLNNDSDKLSNKKYLELYFEYVFGQILRGESV